MFKYMWNWLFGPKLYKSCRFIDNKSNKIELVSFNDSIEIVHSGQVQVLMGDKFVRLCQSANAKQGWVEVLRDKAPNKKHCGIDKKTFYGDVTIRKTDKEVPFNDDNSISLYKFEPQEYVSAKLDGDIALLTTKNGETVSSYSNQIFVLFNGRLLGACIQADSEKGLVIVRKWVSFNNSHWEEDETRKFYGRVIIKDSEYDKQFKMSDYTYLFQEIR